MKIIDGEKIATKIIEDLKQKVEKLSSKPGLAVVLVGDDPASHTYVRMKRKCCKNIGIESYLFEYKADASEATVLEKIKELNTNDKIDGILVQLPLPFHINTKKVIEALDPKKDVDGFHPINVGRALIGYDDAMLSCTPFGIKVLLEEMNIDVEGKHVVIVGRSNLVGKPLGAILVQKKKSCNATVTICHSRTKDLKRLTLTADILVAAIGKPNFITKDLVSHGCVVIDVGINHVKQTNGTTKIIGDVDFENVKDLCSYITPVPKGVGPMTIAMLLNNTIICHTKNQKA